MTTPLPHANAPDFLAGDGEMARRMRAFGLVEDTAGAASSVAAESRSAVSILLPSTAQIILFWGPEFVVLYNDAYRPVFGASTRAHSGCPGARRSEIWDSVLHERWRACAPRVKRSPATACSSSSDSATSRKPFDVSYDPVRDESGAVGGVFASSARPLDACSASDG